VDNNLDITDLDDLDMNLEMEMRLLNTLFLNTSIDSWIKAFSTAVTSKNLPDAAYFDLRSKEISFVDLNKLRLVLYLANRNDMEITLLYTKADGNTGVLDLTQSESNFRLFDEASRRQDLSSSVCVGSLEPAGPPPALDLEEPAPVEASDSASAAELLENTPAIGGNCYPWDSARAA
jgi:hypothetical protein